MKAKILRASNLLHSWNKRAFERAAKGILLTPPLRPNGDSPLFLSMVCHRDLTIYLLAIKSLYVRVGHGRVAIINDGSLSSGDLAVLRQHVAGIEVFDITTVETGTCPRGGTWERLVKIVELSKDCYVIQLDADTLACRPVPEVIGFWQDNRSFLLGTGSGRSILPALTTARMVRGWIATYGWTKLTVGVEAEASLDKLPWTTKSSYVHASSGFAGFARGAFSMDELTSFSTHMSDLLGAQRWREWGSEQIASNYLLANAPGAVVLPFPRYACFEPHLQFGKHAFLHFLGEYRYNRGIYKQLAAEFIAGYDRLSSRYASPAAASCTSVRDKPLDGSAKDRRSRCG